jgi:hypothetical protein
MRILKALGLVLVLLLGGCGAPKMRPGMLHPPVVLHR